MNNKRKRKKKKKRTEARSLRWSSRQPGNIERCTSKT
jgi:hypothetical protein